MIVDEGLGIILRVVLSILAAGVVVPNLLLSSDLKNELDESPGGVVPPCGLKEAEYVESSIELIWLW